MKKLNYIDLGTHSGQEIDFVLEHYKYFEKEFVHRNKIGFMLGFDGWNDKFDQVISNCDIMNCDIFNKNFNISRVKDGYLKFAFLMFCIWYEENYV